MPSGCSLLVLYEAIASPPTNGSRPERVGKRGRDDVDDPAERVRAVHDAGRAADDLDPVGFPGFDLRPVLVAPLLALDPLAVGEDQHAIGGEAADDRLSDAGARC